MTQWDRQWVRTQLADKDLPQVMACLEELTPEDRTRAAQAIAQHGRRALGTYPDPQDSSNLLVMASHLEVPVAALLKLVGYWNSDYVADSPEYLESFLAGLATAERAQAVVAGLVKRGVDSFNVRFIDAIVEAFHLELPTSPGFWGEWMNQDSGLAFPAPRRRWQQHFLAMCAIPEAIGNAIGDRDGYWRKVATGLGRLRRVEPVDDEACLGALLQVFERGDRSVAQRNACGWLSALNLEPLLWGQRSRVLAALPSADAGFIKLAVAELLRPELAPADLDALALVVLARQEKSLKREILKSLTALKDPSVELRDTVAELAAAPDAATAKLARQVIEQWGASTAEPTLQGLWREPSLERAVLPQIEAVATVEELADVMEAVTFDIRDHHDTAETALATVVTTSHRSGTEFVMPMIRQWHGHEQENRNNLTTRSLWRLAQQGVVEEFDAPPLSSLVRDWMVETARRLGTIPELLSTPTHEGKRVSWEAFTQRVEAYRSCDVPLGPVDLMLTLGRLDRLTAPSDFSGFVAPIDGVNVGLDEVLIHWRDTPVAPAVLSLSPSAEQGLDIEVSGETPAEAQLLGIEGAWVSTFVAEASDADEDHSVLDILPVHPARPAANILRALSIERDGYVGEWDQPATMFLRAARAADPFGPILGFAALAVASSCESKRRPAIAEALLTAWDQGRLRAEDLTGAWEAEWRQLWPLEGARIVAVLKPVAEAGGLAIVWPLLARIADELSAQPKIPASTSAVLELVATLLPEVPSDQREPLPNVASLASRKGSSKAIIAARTITAELSQS